MVGLARSDLDLDALAALSDEEVKSGSPPSAGSASGRPTGSSPATSPARGHGRAGDLGLRKAVLAFYGDVDIRSVVERFDPFQNLTVHYLLTGARVLG